MYKDDQVNRADNRQIFLNIDLLHEAIENKSKCSSHILNIQDKEQ